MDSQYEKLSTNDASIKVKKKGKRKAELNAGEVALQKYYGQVKTIIMPAYKELLQLGRGCGYFKKQEQDNHGNNAVARQTAKDLVSIDDDALHEWCTEAKDCTAPPATVVLDTQSNDVVEVPVNTLVYNERCSVSRMVRDGHHYIIPPAASFLCSDIAQVHNLKQDGRLYDVIVLDPPWQNKSVKRKKTYHSLSTEDLVEQLPLGDVMAPGCLVVVWVTNKQAQQEFVRETLFPKFGISYCTQWYWLKVTACGEPVCDMDSCHKKPFESMLIGCYNGDTTAIPRDQLLISVPCVLHSRKPPLNDILEKVHPSKKPRCLELFARNLLPGWTSWGNEVVKYQDEKYFECSITRTTQDNNG